ncbi:MAG: hypothetical protein DRP74_06045 [Candidatus Omnitrophota bacterium]|nr:MAG: hypothetical protein DRP74_06045 [Candidatus Omnitrophota bacterium]
MKRKNFNHTGQPTEKQHKIKIFLSRLIKNWKQWVTVLVSVIALGVSITGIYIANKANEIALKNHDITQKLSKLDFRPIIRLYTLFRPAGKIPPHFALINIGPEDALQIKVRMLTHRYSPKREKMYASIANTLYDVVIPKLSPQETKAFKFKGGSLDSNARLATPPENNIMEIRVTYRRPQDLQEFDESAFYFINPEGLWVPERSSSIESENYQKMKKALLNWKSSKNIISIYDEWKGDDLHVNDQCITCPSSATSEHKWFI